MWDSTNNIGSKAPRCPIAKENLYCFNKQKKVNASIGVHRLGHIIVLLTTTTRHRSLSFSLPFFFFRRGLNQQHFLKITFTSNSHTTKQEEEQEKTLIQKQGRHSPPNELPFQTTSD